MTSLRGHAAGAPIAPLAALFVLAVLAMAWVASTDVCTRPMTMADMTMPGSGDAVMVCPVVLALMVLATLLAAYALVAIWRDPHRRLSAALLVRIVARLPVGPTFAFLVCGGGCAIGAIIAVDGHSALDLSLCLTLSLLVAGMAFAATAAALLVARLLLALCTRLIVALLRAIAERRRRATRLFRARITRVHARRRPFGFERALRGPPLPASA